MGVSSCRSVGSNCLTKLGRARGQGSWLLSILRHSRQAEVGDGVQKLEAREDMRRIRNPSWASKLRSSEPESSSLRSFLHPDESETGLGVVEANLDQRRSAMTLSLLDFVPTRLPQLDVSLEKLKQSCEALDLSVRSVLPRDLLGV